jgi:hypothetical protein
MSIATETQLGKREHRLGIRGEERHALSIVVAIVVQGCSLSRRPVERAPGMSNRAADGRKVSELLNEAWLVLLGTQLVPEWRKIDPA